MENPLAFVIEDDINLAKAFGDALEEAQYQVEIINNGCTALDRLSAARPVTVVLDLHIPYVNGAEVLKYIRSDERLTNIRVIVATADDQEASMLENLANLVLLKPIGYQQLRDLAYRLRPRDVRAGE